ncbi:MAG: hypothetical protein K2O10_00545, partial [Muribaculaceae bacterium]|nr:hypothetical protein [Muribaculaceae bacterium]
HLCAGAVWYQPLTNDCAGAKVQPPLYYRHDGGSRSPWRFSMGMFPRTQLRQQMPAFLWSDSLAYTQRNIRGALMQYEHRRGFIDAYIDWRGMQSATTREAFNVVVHGRWQPRRQCPVIVGGHAMMNHFALRDNAPADEHIVDNFVVNPYAGVDLSGRTACDSLAVRLGPLVTIERNRANDAGWKSPVGAWAEAFVSWRWLAVKNTFYYGGRQFASYIPFRGDLYQGEPFFQSRFYNRTDIFGRIYRNRWVDLQASLDFHVADGSFIFYQRLMVRVNIGNLSGRR